MHPIPDILDDLRGGKMIVLVDDEQSENEGDLVGAAQYVTPEAVNFMLREARGDVEPRLKGAARISRILFWPRPMAATMTAPP